MSKSKYLFYFCPNKKLKYFNVKKLVLHTISNVDDNNVVFILQKS